MEVAAELIHKAPIDTSLISVIAAELAKENHNLSIKSLTKTRLSSQVWRHFGMLFRANKCIDSQHIYCRQCFLAKSVKRYNSSTATNSLRFHLTGKHNTPIRLTNNCEENRVNLCAWTSRSSTVPLVEYERKEFQLALDIALWICRDLVPVDAVCKEGFRQFCVKYNILKEDEQLPHPSTISHTALNYIYCTIHDHVLKVILPKISTFAVSIDWWTDNFRAVSHLTLNLHWVNDEWEVQGLCLRSSLLELPVTAECISSRLLSTLEEYNFGKASVVASVARSGGIVAEALDIMNLRKSQCIAHSLEMLLKDVLTHGTMQRLRELLAKLRSCLTTIARNHQSLLSGGAEVDAGLSQLLEDMEPIDEMLECDGRVLNKEDNDSILVCGARWTTLLTMLRSLIMSNAAIRRSLEKLHMFEYIMDEDEITLAEDLAEILYSIKNATDIFQGSSFPPISAVLLLRSDISKRLQEMMGKSCGIKESAIGILLDRLESTLPLSDENVCGAILDPSTQNLELILEYLQAKGETKLEFLRRVGKSFGVWIVGEDDSEPQTDAEKSKVESNCPLWKKMRLEMLKRNTVSAISTDSIEMEVFMYQQICEEILDPVEWWRKNHQVFPKLSKLAKCVLGIPATSVESERGFSESGSLLNSKMLQLSPMRVEQTIFIHRNYSLFHK